MKVLLVVNVEAHAVGTLARLFALHAPLGWQVKIVSCYHMDNNPMRFEKWVAWADVVHWTNHKVFSRSGVFRQVGRHIVSVHHFEGDEGDARYLQEAECVVVHAESVECQVRDRVEPDRPVLRFAYPVDASFFETGRKRMAHPPTAPKRPVIGFFSSARYESSRKGIDLLPAVLDGLAERGIRPILYVTGDGWRELIRQDAFMRHDVQYIAVPSYFDMPARYAALDLYLCLSRLEGGPMTVFEAIACGVPAVSTPVGRIPDSLSDIDYRRIPFDDSVAATNAIVDVLQDSILSVGMQQRARTRIKPVVDVATYVQGLSRIYAGDADCADFCLRRYRPSAVREFRALDRISLAGDKKKHREYRGMLALILSALCIAPFSAAVWRALMRGIGVLHDGLEIPKCCGKLE